MRRLWQAALLATAQAWDVHTPTNTTCLSGCACAPKLRACVPTAPSKDNRVFELSLASLARHGVDVSEIWVVSRKAASVDAAIDTANRLRRTRWLDEDTGFPFDYASVRRQLEAARGRAHNGGYQYAVGWYLQQLLKLYCGRAIARADAGRAGPWTGADFAAAAVDVLVVDSDVVWTRDVAFVHACEGGRATYNYAFSRESHQLYYDTNKKLLGSRGAPLPDAGGRDISGVVHHMVFRGDVVAALEALVAQRHGGGLHEVFLKEDIGIGKEAHRNAFSEYQLYFHFARRRFPDSIRVRQLYWANGPGPRSVVACGRDGWPADTIKGLRGATDAADEDARAGYDFAAYHSYAKRRPCVYGPSADAIDGGACFGGGCTRACFKSRIDERFKRRDRAGVAPRLCAAPPRRRPASDGAPLPRRRLASDACGPRCAALRTAEPAALRAGGWLCRAVFVLRGARTPDADEACGFDAAQWAAEAPAPKGGGLVVVAVQHNGLGNQLFEHAFGRLLARATGSTFAARRVEPRERPMGPPKLAPHSGEGWTAFARLFGAPARPATACAPLVPVQNEYALNGTVLLAERPADTRRRPLRRQLQDALGLLDTGAGCLATLGYWQNAGLYAGVQGLVRTLLPLRGTLEATPAPEAVVVHVRLCSAPAHQYRYFGWDNYFAHVLAPTDAVRVVSACSAARPGAVRDILEHIPGARLARPRLVGSKDRVAADFLYLARAKRLVITESTFSFWAAFLGDAVEVHAPAGGSVPTVPGGHVVYHDVARGRYRGRVNTTARRA